MRTTITVDSLVLLVDEATYRALSDEKVCEYTARKMSEEAKEAIATAAKRRFEKLLDAEINKEAVSPEKEFFLARPI